MPLRRRPNVSIACANRNSFDCFDGLSIEEWSYVTDYMRHADTMITFVGGKVVEIRVVPWEEKD